jgi:CubicO group peptidase (beta-lactamase class C family)
MPLPPLLPLRLAALRWFAALALAGLRVAAADFSTFGAFIAEELRRTQVPGAAVAVVAAGEVAFADGFGTASVETGGPVTADTLFRVGSTTKMFTAAGLVLLAHEDRLRLDAPIGDYASGLHPAIARLTSHQLLTHTSGLADPNAMNGPHDDTALAARVRALGPRDCFDEPGRIHSYSNAGYWLAGFVAQEVAGRPYADHLEARLFRPLGMTRSTFRPTMAMTWPLAIGHGPEGAGPPAVVRPLADNAAGLAGRPALHHRAGVRPLLRSPS